MNSQEQLAAQIDKVAMQDGLPQPRGKRAWGPFTIFSTSVATAIATWCFIIGGFVAYYLPAGTGTLAIIAGSLLGILFIVLACLPVSSKYGIDVVAASKPQLGSRGSVFAILLVYGATLGWNVFLFVLLGRAVTAILGGFGIAPQEWMTGVFGGIGVLVVLAMLRNGAENVRKFGIFISLAVLGLSIVIMIMLIASSGLETLIAAPAVAAWDSTAVNWTSAIEVLIASNLSWWAYTGAMVRNSPSARSSLWPVVFGLGLAVGVGSLTGLYGALLQPDSGGDPTQYLVDVGGPVFGVIALVFIVLANVGTALVGAYASTIAFRQIATVRKLSWFPSTLIATVPALVLVVFFSGFVFDNFGTFLSMLGLAFAPMCGIQIVDYFLLRRQRLDVASIYQNNRDSQYWYWGGVNIIAFIAFIAGAAAYLYLLDPVTYISRPPFEFMTASIPALVVAGFVYWVGTKLVSIPAGKGGYTKLHTKLDK
ncbi:purine-cytosine permease family protein [Leucobacter sp. W1038]|uniref:purine-cytosine permease family protein n=1 Tax=Leucobacter sp. W1038 TaxID=3438281 RepID=UPI003D95A3DC